MNSTTTTSPFDDKTFYGDPAELPLWVAYGVKVPALMSILGSTGILCEVAADLRSNKSDSISRILLSMSVADIMYSSSWFVSTWVAPKDLTYLGGTNHGNYQTCVTQGFFTELGGVGALFFNTFLAVAYLLVVKYNWKDFQVKTIEKPMQWILWTLALACAIIPIPLDMYHNGGPICYIDSHPLGCRQSWELPPDKPTNCTRGDNSIWVVLALGLAPILISWLAASVIMMMVFCAIFNLEKRNMRYAGSSSMNADRSRQQRSSNQSLDSSMHSIDSNGTSLYSVVRHTITQLQFYQRSRMVAIQGMWYLAGFLLTYSLYLAFVVLMLVGIWVDALGLAAFFFLASQGIWNFCIFSRKRTMKRKLASLSNGSFGNRCAVYHPIA